MRMTEVRVDGDLGTDRQLPDGTVASLMEPRPRHGADALAAPGQHA